MRDKDLLESAVARPKNKYHYSDVRSIFDLAAAYAAGISRNHPFVDGNKRACALAIRAFLHKNGYRFEPTEVELVKMMRGLAGRQVSETTLSEWIEEQSQRKEGI